MQARRKSRFRALSGGVIGMAGVRERSQEDRSLNLRTVRILTGKRADIPVPLSLPERVAWLNLLPGHCLFHPDSCHSAGAEGNVDSLRCGKTEIGVVKDQGGRGCGPDPGLSDKVRGDDARSGLPSLGEQCGNEVAANASPARSVLRGGRSRGNAGTRIVPGSPCGVVNRAELPEGPSVTTRIDTRQATSSRSSSVSHSCRLQQSRSIEPAKLDRRYA